MNNLIEHGKMKHMAILLVFLVFMSCKEEQKEQVEIVEEVKEKSIKQVNEELIQKGYKTFDFVDEVTKDTMLMQQYFYCLFKKRAK